VLLGGMGLGAEVGYWYLTERKLQHAADLAAYGAAVRLYRGDEEDVLDAVGLHVASESGFRQDHGAIAVNHPPLSGPYAGDPGMVEVDLTEAVDRYFTQFFAAGDSVSLSGRAVAEYMGGTVCALALSTTANNALHASGSASATFENCVVASNSESNSSFHMQGATLNADCVYTAGGYKETGGNNTLTLTDCSGVEVDHDPIDDPYEDVPVPTPSTACINPGTVENTTLTPTLSHPSGVSYVRYCSLNVKGNVTFNPGLYFIDGAFGNTGVTNLSGSGVTFVLGGDVTLTGNITMTLSAPAEGQPHAGFLFFGDKDATKETIKITGNSTSVLTGSVYFKTGNLTYTGSSASSGGCTQLIANTISFAGNSSVASSCGAAGVEEVLVGTGLSQLVE